MRVAVLILGYPCGTEVYILRVLEEALALAKEYGGVAVEVDSTQLAGFGGGPENFGTAVEEWHCLDHAQMIACLQFNSGDAFPEDGTHYTFVALVDGESGLSEWAKQVFRDGNRGWQAGDDDPQFAPVEPDLS